MNDGKEYIYQYDASEKTLQKFNEDILNLIDKYKKDVDNYKLGLIIGAIVIGVALVLTIIIIIVKNKKEKKKSKVKLNKISSDINF